MYYLGAREAKGEDWLDEGEAVLARDGVIVATSAEPGQEKLNQIKAVASGVHSAKRSKRRELEAPAEKWFRDKNNSKTQQTVEAVKTSAREKKLECEREILERV